MIAERSISKHEAAVTYAESGFSVVPCWPNSKVVMTDNGFYDATTDTDQIDAWWTQTPDANIAIRTDGLVVIDVDPNEDGSRNQWMRDNPDQFMDLPVNAVATTPRGGTHYWFAQLPGQPIRSVANDPVEKVDIRADGGYIMVAPSYVKDDKKGIDGSYGWTIPPGMKTELSAVPTWFTQSLKQTKKPEQKVDQTIVTPDSGFVGLSVTVEAIQLTDNMPKEIADNRDSWLRVGMALHSICAALLFVWIQFSKRSSKYQPGECERLWNGFHANRENGVGIGTLRHYSQSSKANERRLNWIPSSEFASTFYPQDYIVDGILCSKQNCIVAARSKSMKTTTAIDLAISVASATPFLGKFNVKTPRRVAFVSGESGEKTIQETSNRICASKGKSLASLNIKWGFNLPRLSVGCDLLEFRDLLVENSIQLVILDPLYLCLLDEQSANQASNLLGMGPRLNKLTELLQGTDCTIVCIHHARKNTLNPYAPLELEDMAMAGFAEWARQWILWSRREDYEQGSGVHRLWMNVGGSAGHNSLWGVNINEGHPDLYGGRYWQVEIESGSDLRKEQQTSRQQAKESRIEEAIKGRQAKVMETLRNYPDGLSKSAIGEKSGVNARHTGHCLELLLHEDLIEECHVEVANRKKPIPGYRIIDRCPTSPTGMSDSLSVGMA